MATVKLSDFYYGAALSWLFNNKIKPVLLNIGEDRQEYEFTTDNKDFLLFLMYRMEKDNKKEDYSSWTFGDIRKDIDDLMKEKGDKKNPVLALMCIKKGLKGSEMALLFQNDIERLVDKKSFTINRKKGEKQFRIPIGGGRENSIKIKCDRSFEDVDK